MYLEWILKYNGNEYQYDCYFFFTTDKNVGLWYILLWYN